MTLVLTRPKSRAGEPSRGRTWHDLGRAAAQGRATLGALLGFARRMPSSVSYASPISVRWTVWGCSSRTVVSVLDYDCYLALRYECMSTPRVSTAM